MIETATNIGTLEKLSKHSFRKKLGAAPYLVPILGLKWFNEDTRAARKNYNAGQELVHATIGGALFVSPFYIGTTGILLYQFADYLSR